jgi:hypothetical protein
MSINFVLNEAHTYVKNLTKFCFCLHFEKQDQKLKLVAYFIMLSPMKVPCIGLCNQSTNVFMFVMKIVLGGKGHTNI